MGPAAPVSSPPTPAGRLPRDSSPRTRRSRWTDPAPFADVEVSVASQTTALERAFRLVHDQYVDRGYMARHRSGWRLSLHHSVPTTRVFLASRGDSVLATVTVIQDSPLGLPMDEIYQAELDGLRHRGRSLCEVSALASIPSTRAEGLGLVMRLLRTTLLYAAEVARQDDLCLTVNPRHVEFYERFFDCRQFGSLKPYGKVNGAPAVLLRLDLDWVRDTLQCVQAGAITGDARLDFLYGREGYDGVMRQLQHDLRPAAMTRRQFLHFFGNHEVFTGAPPHAQTLIRSWYPQDSRSLQHRPGADGDVFRMLCPALAMA